MKRSYHIALIILLVIISMICIFVPPLNNFPARIVPVMLLLFLPGFALSTVFYFENVKLTRKILISFILSFFIIFILSSIFNSMKMAYVNAFLVIGLITIIIALTGCIIRLESPKKYKKNFIVCDKCNGYYKLQKGESLGDFEFCECGGKLKYADSILKPAKKPKHKFKFLKEIVLLIVIVSLAVVVASVPALSNTILRLIFILPLLFFLPGYSLTKAIFMQFSKFKLILSSIIWSILITFFLSLIFSLNTPGASYLGCIIILSLITIALSIISVIRRSKSKQIPENYLKEKTHFKPKSRLLKFVPSDILMVWLTTVLCVIFVLTPILNDTIFRIILGLLLILFIPGYSLIAALFPKKGDLDGIERTALSFGLSIAVTPLIGLILNYTPFGIRLAPILISLSAFTIIISIIAYIRRLKLPEDEKFTVEFKKYYNGIVNSFKGESRGNKILSIILIASIIIAISTTLYIIVTPKEGEKFTEFYILGPNGKASDYPTNLTAGETGNVTIGVVNHEYATINYQMIIKLNNQTIKEENITLSSNEKYETPFTFNASRSGEKQKLEFLLYKLPDDNNSYRSLHLWIDVN
jgi:uncharacterized membrane protein